MNPRLRGSHGGSGEWFETGCLWGVRRASGTPVRKQARRSGQTGVPRRNGQCRHRLRVYCQRRPAPTRFVANRKSGVCIGLGPSVEVRESKIENPQSKISRFASVWGHQSKCAVTTKTEGSYHCREWPNAPSIVHVGFRSEGISAMPSRFVSLAILVYWCIAAFCLLTWEVLPELTLGYPPDLRRSPRPVTPPSRSRGASRSSMIPKPRTSGDRSARRSPHRSASRMGGSSSAAG